MSVCLSSDMVMCEIGIMKVVYLFVSGIYYLVIKGCLMIVILVIRSVIFR